MKYTLKMIVAVSVMAFMTSGLARASDYTSFDIAVSKSYGAFRSAANYLRTGNPGIAFLELSDALDAWQKLSREYASSPPKAYASDPEFKATLERVEKALAKGLIQAENGDSKESLNTISPVRDMIYELHKRNDVRLYADCVTELNRAMEPIYVYRHHEPNLKDKAVKAQITGESELYVSLLTDCRELAPKAYKTKSEFTHLYDGTMESIQSMFPAIESGDPVRVVNVIRELRSFDRIIYFKFGG